NKNLLGVRQVVKRRDGLVLTWTDIRDIEVRSHRTQWIMVNWPAPCRQPTLRLCARSQSTELAASRASYKSRSRQTVAQVSSALPLEDLRQPRNLRSPRAAVRSPSPTRRTAM